MLRFKLFSFYSSHFHLIMLYKLLNEMMVISPKNNQNDKNIEMKNCIFYDFFNINNINIIKYYQMLSFY